MKIAVLTGGGDCPGLNSVIQAIFKRSSEYGYEVLGVRDGYRGLLTGDIKPLSIENVEDIFRVGGTFLGTSRTNPFKVENGPQKVLNTIKRLCINALIVIGGDDTLEAAYKLNKLGVPAVGVPKTIDNDLSATDYCVGFWTAVETAAEAISRLHSTAKSHSRVIIAEVMGRHSGWLTLMAGLAAGAHLILLPERIFKVESVCDLIMKREAKGKTYTIIAVAEGAKPEDVEKLFAVSKERDDYGHIRLGGIAKFLAKEIAARTGKTVRSVVLGHVQRGGAPGSFDRILGIRLGLFAVDLVKEEKFGYVATLKGTKIVSAKFERAIKKLKMVEEELFQLTNFFSKI